MDRMKFLINTTYNTALQFPGAEETQRLLSGFEEHMQSIADKVECFYETSWDSGFAIIDVDTVEEAWQLVMANPMFPYWKVELKPLADPTAQTRAYAQQALQAASQALSR
jgi:hypothetical protein